MRGRHDTFDPSLEYARSLDAQDPLGSYRQRFYIPANTIYLDGNSLGPASVEAEQALLTAMQSWKSRGIGGWLDGSRPWFYMAEELGAIQAEMVGALPAEVVVTGATTVNQHTLVATFYRPKGRRTKVIADALNFPSDIYALQSQLRLHGYDPETELVLVPSRDGRTLAEDDIIAAMGDDVALVLLPAVLYRSGQLLDMERLARAARSRGIPIGFDCSHSAGSVPHRLHDWGIDFAFWCNYKYFNGGPGAVASLFVHQRHFGTIPGLTGWFGCHKERQFDMNLEFEPAPGAGAWQISTPAVLSMAPLYGSMQIFREAGIDRVRAKSVALTSYLVALVQRSLPKEVYGFSIGTPLDPSRRGGHLSLEHAEAVRICKALKTQGVVPDYRRPNVVRLAPVALYNTYEEVWLAVQKLKVIMETRAYEGFPPERDTVA